MYYLKKNVLHDFEPVYFINRHVFLRFKFAENYQSIFK